MGRPRGSCAMAGGLIMKTPFAGSCQTEPLGRARIVALLGS
jgi:hypothetical protein